MSFPLTLLLQANLALLFFFFFLLFLPLLMSLLGTFVQNPARVGKHSAKIQHDPACFSHAAFCCCCDHLKGFAFSSKRGQAVFGMLRAQEAHLSLLVHVNATQFF